jgi:diaminopimelate epimerase
MLTVKNGNILFTKMQGAGNDFLVIDHAAGVDYAALAVKACDRHMGVGADGILVLDASLKADHRMRIINADGSEAEMCGNGARCMAVYIARKFARGESLFTMETLAGTLQARVQGETASVQLSAPADYRPDIGIPLSAGTLQGHYINTGVPHVVIFVDDLNGVDVNGLGAQVRRHAAFAPRGTNVNFVQRLQGDAVALRTYERGVEAETLACGTGSVASALIGYLKRPSGPSAGPAAVKVLTRSGEYLDVKFDLSFRGHAPLISNVWLTGSGKIICKGEYYGA